MIRITKNEFMDICQEGVFYVDSVWDTPLGKIQAFTFLNQAKAFHDCKKSRLLINRNIQSLKYKTNNTESGFSYNDIADSRKANVFTTCYKSNGFLITHTTYDNKTTSTVIYATKN